jgi:hypothetical protein
MYLGRGRLTQKSETQFRGLTSFCARLSTIGRAKMGADDRCSFRTAIEEALDSVTGSSQTESTSSGRSAGLGDNPIVDLRHN